ncbi:MAG: ABC transporter ATP-binding protein [Bacillota bacterium]
MGIIIDSLGKSYQNGRESTEVLRDVSLKVNDGEWIAIVGPSGSGKSTLMNIIGCLDRFDKGRYYLDGNDIRLLKEDQLAEIRNKRIGFVFQSFNLLPQYTAVENVELPLLYNNIAPKTARHEAQKILETLGLKDRLTYKPPQLSGGQKQRVAIARAIVNSPALILADEPTGSLDSKTGREVLDIFRYLQSLQKTVVMVTHDPGIAREANRIILIRDGQISEVGHENP